MSRWARRAACALVAALAAAGAGASAVAQSFGPTINTQNASGVELFAINVPTTITGAATLSLTLYGDFNGANSGLTVTIDGLLIGTLFSGGANVGLFNGGNGAQPCNSGVNGIATVTAVIPEAAMAPLIADQTVTISLQAGSDVGQNCNGVAQFPSATPFSFAASGVLAITPGQQAAAGGGIVFAPGEEAAAAAQSLAVTRSSIALANIPSLAGRISGGGGSSASGSGDDSSGGISFSTSLEDLRRAAAMAGDGEIASFDVTPRRWDLWVGGGYSYFNSDVGGVGAEGGLGLAQAGVDYRVNDRLLVGVAVFGDLLDSQVASGIEARGIGFMAGPYAVLQLGDGVYLEGLAAVGRAYNDLDAPLAPATASYESDRLLLTTRLSGEWRVDAWSIRPGARVSYYAEKQQAFLDGFGAPSPENTSLLGQLKFGPEVSYELDLGGFSAQPFIGAEGAWAFMQSDPSVAGATIPLDDFSTSVSLGIDALLGPATLRAAGRVDGLGSDQFESFTGELQIRLPLN